LNTTRGTVEDMMTASMSIGTLRCVISVDSQTKYWSAVRCHSVEVRQVPIGRGPNPAHRAYSDNGLVPCLHEDDGFRVWDSLAIAETLAERHPGLWPDHPRARARARSVSAEMHAGFSAMRSAMPMNVKLKCRGAMPSPEVRADIDRIVAIWTEAREQFAPLATTPGPWLFGAFSVADAMFAPVVWRFETYNVALPPVAAAWKAAMLDHPARREWERGALAERVSLPYDDAAARWGGPR
jgi:glutathione S-transferase